MQGEQSLWSDFDSLRSVEVEIVLTALTARSLRGLMGSSIAERNHDGS